MLSFHLITRIAAIALFCTVAYEGGQFVKGTLEGVTSAMQAAHAPQD